MRNRKRTPVSEVIKDFMSGNYPQQLSDKVYRWLVSQDNAEEKERALREEWESLDVSEMKPPHASFEQVKAKIGWITKPKRIWIKHAAKIAAVVVPLIVIAAVVLMHATEDKELYAKIEVPYGETREIVLPDGSKVWVNAGTKLEYFGKEKSGDRLVEMDGEAYFEVLHDEARPFTVNTDKVSVRVLGTEFNVQSYSGQHTYVVTLKSGKIEVIPVGGGKFVLKPAQQFIYGGESGEKYIQTVDADDYSGWKDGKLIFSDVTLQYIFETLERTYNAEIEIDTTVTTHNDHYSVKFVDGESLHEAMDIMMYLTEKMGYTYRIENNKVIVTANR